MINKITLLGHLGADPEVRTLENGAMVAKLRLATSESYRDKAGNWQEETQWHDIVVWRYLAERAQKYLKKGSLIYLEGKLTHRKWQDKDGNNRKTTEVVGSTFRMLDGRRDGNDDSQERDSYGADNTQSSTPQSESKAEAPAMEPEDELPF